VLRDDRTGLEVLTGASGALRLVNTNTQDAITGEGIGYYTGATPTSTSITFAHGEHVDEAYDAVSFTYGQYVFMRQPDISVLQLTRLERLDGAQNVISCVAVS